CHSGGATGFRKKHALCCFAGTGLAVVVGRVRPARSGARLPPANSPTRLAQGLFYRVGREIAAILPDRSRLRPNTKGHARASTPAHRSGRASSGTSTAGF